MKRLGWAISLLCVVLLVSSLVPAVVQATPSPGDIVAVAGTAGSTGYGGDSGPGTSALLNSPQGVAVDGAGNIYIADRFNYVIRKVATDGTITTVAGNHVLAISSTQGDDGLATSASFKSPVGVAVDGAGNIYIADPAARVVRKVTAATGIIKTVAGTGTSGSTGDGGPATAATLTFPWGLALDGGGNLYISDFTAGKIRKVGTDGNISTVTSAIASPSWIAVDSSNNLYVSVTSGNVVQKVAAGTAAVTTVAGIGTQTYSGDGGPATSAGLAAPQAVAVDASGNLYIADQGNSRIRKVVSGVILTVAGTGVAGIDGNGGPATSATLNAPSGIAVDSTGNFWIADQTSHTVRKVLAKTVPVVSINLPGGTYYSSQTITLTANMTATVYYTLDGTDPTISGTRHSLATSGSFTISSATTLRYYAVATTGETSTPATQSYTFSSATVPGPPTITSILPDNGIVTVTFSSPASDGGAPITGYTVVSTPAGGLDENAGLITNTHTVTNLVNGTSYTFKVMATNAVGSTASTTSSPVVPGGAPNAPTNVAATAGDGYATVTFSPVVNNGYAVSLYTVTSSTGITATGPGSPITVNGLNDGTAYTFTVTATNAMGTSPASAASNVVTPLAPTVPDAPTAVVATAGYGQATVTFSAPASNGGVPILGYGVISLPAGGTDSNYGSNSLTHTITGLTYGTTYTFTAVAMNSVGSSASSTPSNSITITPAVVGMTVGAPSAAVIKPGTTVTYTVSYTGADNVTLTAANVSLQKTGTANGTVAVSGTGSLTRTVTISGITGDGTLGIGIASGTASAFGGPATAPAVSASTTFTVDGAAPTLSVISLADAARTSNNTLTVSGTATDTTAVAGVTVNGTAVALGNGAFSTALKLTSGLNSVVVVATDTAGNQASDTRTITYDATAPQVTFAAATPADGSFSNLSGVTFQGTVDRAATVTVTVNSDTPIVVSTGGSDNAFSVPVTLIPGTNRITVLASDADAITSTVARSVTYDASAVALAISDPAQDITTTQSSYLVKGALPASFAGSSVSLALDGVALTPAVTASSDGSFQQTVNFTTAKTYQVTATVDVSGTLTTVQRNIVYNPVASLKLSTVTGAKGATVTVPLTFANPTATSIDGLTIDIGYDTSVLSAPAATLSATLSSAGFTLQGSTPSAGTYRVVIAKATPTAIGAGVVANATFTVSSAVVSGTSTTLFSTPAATDLAGNPAEIVGTNGSITFITKAGDCNGDGKVTLSEVQGAINMFLGTKAVASCVDTSGNGVVSLSEVQKTINSFLGL